MASQHRSGKWQGAYVDANGKRKKRNFDTVTLAEKWERDGRVEADKIRVGLVAGPKVTRTLESMWDGWLATRSAKRRKDDLSRWVHHVGPFFGADDVDTIGKLRLDAFVRHMEEKVGSRPGQVSKTKLKPNTIKRCLTLVCQLVADLTERRIVYKYKVPTTSGAWLKEPAHIRAFLAECNDDTMRIASAIALYAGLRKGEVAGIHVREIDFLHGMIEVNWSFADPVKSKHHRYVPLSPELASMLKPWIKGKSPDDLVITIGGKMMAEEYDLAKRARRTAKRAGVPSINFHQTRHTYASHMAKKHPLAVVGALLGHADAKTTQRYAHVDPQSLARNPALHLSFNEPTRRASSKPKRAASSSGARAARKRSSPR